MDYKSEYYQKDFLEKVKHYYTKLFFIGLIGIFIIITGISSMGSEKSNENKSFFLDALKELDLESALINFAIALFIIIAIITYLYFRNKTRRIIVGVSFSDKEIITASRNIFSAEIEILNTEIENVLIQTSKISDGLTSPMYDCLIFQNKTDTLGYFIMNHFTWNKENETEIRSTIDKYELMKSTITK